MKLVKDKDKHGNVTSIVLKPETAEDSKVLVAISANAFVEYVDSKNDSNYTYNDRRKILITITDIFNNTI